LSKELDFKVFFFIGKGGVGKTTCAATFALQVAKSKRTLIVSLDPAHNLGDVLGINLGREPARVTGNLHALEVDFEEMIIKHLKDLTEKIKDMYGYLRVLNLDKYVDVLRHSPGIEEYATLDKIVDILKYNVSKKGYDVIIFDTPPTGLTLRMMALPSISAIWVDKLMKLREAILDRRRIVERITGEKIKAVVGGRELEVPAERGRDPIYRELMKMRDEVSLVNSVIKNSEVTTVILVVNPEVLPIIEAKRAFDSLSKLGIKVKYLIVNKVMSLSSARVPEEFNLRLKQEEEALALIKKYFSNLRVIKVPFFIEEPKGVDKLDILNPYLTPLVNGALG